MELVTAMGMFEHNFQNLYNKEQYMLKLHNTQHL